MEGKRKRQRSDESVGSRSSAYYQNRAAALRIRRTQIPRGMQMRIGKLHNFKQTFHPLAANVTTDANCHYSFGGTGAVGSGTLYGPATGDLSPAGYFAMKFTAADLPQFASFSALFDAYRINKVVVQFIPYNYPYQIGNTAANLAAQPQWLSTVIDYDDAALLATEGSLLEYETFKQARPGSTHTRSLVPAVSIEAFKTSGTTIGYSQHRKQWIDAAYGDVEHYGLKGLINGPALQADQVQGAWKVYVTMYITWKQTR